MRGRLTKKYLGQQWTKRALWSTTSGAINASWRVTGSDRQRGHNPSFRAQLSQLHRCPLDVRFGSISLIRAKNWPR